MKRPMPHLRSAQRKSALRLLEEAVSVLKFAPFELLVSYCIGSVPFILGLFYFWTDMSRNAFANERLVIAALGMAALFAWMKIWHALFVHRIWHYLQHSSHGKWTVKTVFSMAAAQTLIHATGFFILPAPLLAMLPFGWCYAFYQNSHVFSGPGSPDLKSTIVQAWQQAKLWPRQNHLLMAIVSVLAVVMFINLAIGIISVPYLFKRFLGIETLFTMSGIHVLNTTFLITAWGCTHLCIDPIIKTAYVLRCHYGMSMKNGSDIKAELNRLMQKTLPAAVVLLCVFAGPIAAFSASPSPTDPPASASSSISPDALDRSIRQVLEQRKFSWRMPREAQNQESEEAVGPLTSIVTWIVDTLQQILETIFDWIDSIIEWLEQLLPEPEMSQQPPRDSSRWSIRTLLVLLFLVIAVALVMFVVYVWHRRKAAVPKPVDDVSPVDADLGDEAIKANDLPMEQWLSLAKEKLEKGELRLAIRAVYLAILAGLADEGFITIEAYKSNREYERELRRRSHERKVLLKAFSKSVHLFERVWYGMHAVTRTEVIQYLSLQKGMRDSVR